MARIKYLGQEHNSCERNITPVAETIFLAKPEISLDINKFAVYEQIPMEKSL